MRLEQQEKVRLAELLSPYALGISANVFDNFNPICSDVFRSVECALIVISIINCITILRQDKLADDYKELEQLYKTVVDNTIELMEELNINDPVSIFSTYVYMYRHGYLSHNKTFTSNFNTKDLGNIGGVDIIRGKGVCRTIASFLTDLYLQKGYDASSLAVASKMAISHIEKLGNSHSENKEMKSSLFNIKKEYDESGQLINAVLNINLAAPSISTLQSFIPSNNHLITTVTDGKRNFVFDPTHDGFLQKGSGNRLLVSNDPKYYMYFYKGGHLLNKSLGQIKAANIRTLNEQFRMPTISYDEYKEIYMETLRICRENTEMFDSFYRDNASIYDEIYDYMENVSGLFGRMTGLGAVKKLVKGSQKTL